MADGVVLAVRSGDGEDPPMPYERLTAADAAFLRIETEHEPQHVGSLSVIDGGHRTVAVTGIVGSHDVVLVRQRWNQVAKHV